MDQPLCYSVQENGFWKCFLSNEPLHKILLSKKVNLNLILELPCALYSVYSHSVGVVGLVEYVCTHPILNLFQRKIQTMFPKTSSRVPSCTQPCLWIGSPAGSSVWRKTLMTPSFVVNVVVWVLVVILAIVTLHCPLPCRVVR